MTTTRDSEDRPTDLVIPLDQLPHITVDDNGWAIATTADGGGGNLGHIEEDPAAAWQAALLALAFAVHLAGPTSTDDVMDVRGALDILTGVRPASRHEHVRARRLVASARQAGALLHLDTSAGARDEPALLSVTQAAERLGISRQAVHERIDAGTLHALLVGGAYVITADALAAAPPRRAGS